MHSARVAGLQRTITQLQSQLATVLEAQKENKRSKYIQQLAKELRQQELVTDVVKRLLVEHTGMTQAEVRFASVSRCTQQRLHDCFDRALPGGRVCAAQEHFWT